MGREGYGGTIADQTAFLVSPNGDFVKPLPDLPLCKVEATVVAVHEITPQRVDNHEYDPVKHRFRASRSIQPVLLVVLKSRETREKWFIRKEADREDEESDREQRVGEN